MNLLLKRVKKMYINVHYSNVADGKKMEKTGKSQIK